MFDLSTPFTVWATGESLGLRPQALLKNEPRLRESFYDEYLSLALRTTAKSTDSLNITFQNKKLTKIASQLQPQYIQL